MISLRKEGSVFHIKIVIDGDNNTAFFLIKKKKIYEYNVLQKN